MPKRKAVDPDAAFYAVLKKINEVQEELGPEDRMEHTLSVMSSLAAQVVRACVHAGLANQAVLGQVMQQARVALGIAIEEAYREVSNEVGTSFEVSVQIHSINSQLDASPAPKGTIFN